MGKANDKKKGHSSSKGEVKLDVVLNKSNFKLIERDFADIITSVRETDQTSHPSNSAVTRKTYRFIDNSFLSITERYVSGGLIDFYNYDWYNSDKSIRMKFHSEPHEDEKYQTETEPYHVHKPNKLGLKEHRLPNHKHKSLYEIMEFIMFSIR
ncbi:hypothetical protein SDC9_138166 [bioreactor metagenome]|uniref:Uncharacterized protein n=1 Tax=bioreactor metagenome TaxID=1076179 RepID=A0A645DP34_9ZZZZ